MIDVNRDRPLVCVLAFDELCMFEFGIAAEAFGLPRPDFDHWYDYKVISCEEGPIGTLGGVTLTADTDLSWLNKASLIVIPGWRDPDEKIPDVIRTALLDAHHNGARIASICLGVFVIAQCGLLDNQDATTHWLYAKKLKELHPNINVIPNILYTDNGRVLTSAGSAAGLDLCLHIIRSDYGAEIANRVAKVLVVPSYRNGDQSQFIERPIAKIENKNIGHVLDMFRTALGEDWTISRMAKLYCASERTFLRNFKKATGHTPKKWLTLERVYLCKDLLETTNIDINSLSVQTGMGSPESLRHNFRKIVGVSPTQYRRQFTKLET